MIEKGKGEKKERLKYRMYPKCYKNYFSTHITMEHSPCQACRHLQILPILYTYVFNSLLCVLPCLPLLSVVWSPDKRLPSYITIKFSEYEVLTSANTTMPECNSESDHEHKVIERKENTDITCMLIVRMSDSRCGQL